ncbi:phage tail tape measure protein [uncultured Clostridium sp.]|uniref:phage tail tape measure protein n=1 Tax=uncultured Clostridium sp. TaxID=59620 RepID=UPI0028EF4874|nr:phage tail tape measure protein [uncultured Clostridium sp.]
MAGWKTNDMLDGLPGILDLAAASGEELGTTSDIVTDALTAFGLKAKDSAYFADLLASASSNSNTNVSMLGESFKYVAPVAGALGISAKDTSFALGLMANAGIKGSAAGTALRSSLTNLANPSKNMKDEMERLGISLIDSNGKVKEGKVLYDELRERFSKLTDAEKAQSAAIIFGKEAMSGMLSVINASDADYSKLYDNLNKSEGAAKKMADTMQNNLKGQLTTLKSAFEELQISLAQSVLPILNEVVQFVTNLVNAFNNLPQPVKSAIGIIIGSIALLSPVFLVLGKLVKTVGSVIGVFSKLGSAVKIFAKLPGLITPHTLLIVGAIAGIGLIVFQVIKHWEKFKESADKIWGGIKTIIEYWVKGTIEFLRTVFISIPKKFFEFGKNIVGGLIGGLKSMIGSVTDTIGNIAGSVKNGFKKLLGINSPSRVFLEYGAFIGEGLIEGIDGQEGAIDNKFKGLASKIKGLGNVRPELQGLNNFALSGAYGGSYGLSNISNSSNKQLNFNPNITMHVSIADTGAKGTEQLTQELKGMSEVALKNSMVDLFMQDAIRN